MVLVLVEQKRGRRAAVRLAARLSAAQAEDIALAAAALSLLSDDGAAEARRRCGRALSRKAVREVVVLVLAPSSYGQWRISLFDADRSQRGRGLGNGRE